MEEALLREMIVERDKKILQLQVTVKGHEDKLDETQVELERVRQEASQCKLEYRRAIAVLVKKRDDGLDKISKKEKEVRNQNGSLHVYADILKEVAPESVDSSYVVRMQSQLCKAMHSMGILEHQLAIVNNISSDVVKAQKEAITAVVDEKSTMELSVMNELVAIDDAKRKVEEEWKAKLEKEQLQVVALRAKLGIRDDEDDSDKDDSSNDDGNSSNGEDEYESELREGLDELNEAITEMKDETSKQLETIASLKAQLDKLQQPSKQSQSSSTLVVDGKQQETLQTTENGNSPIEEKKDHNER